MAVGNDAPKLMDVPGVSYPVMREAMLLDPG
jgi:hypothetical protein